MLNFKSELARFQPIMEVDEIEATLQPSEMQDMLDMLQHITKQTEEAKKEEKE